MNPDVVTPTATGYVDARPAIVCRLRFHGGADSGSRSARGGRRVTVDVVTETEISRAIDEVSSFAADPSNAPVWYANIKSVEWETPPPAAVGSRVAFVAHFLG